LTFIEIVINFLRIFSLSQAQNLLKFRIRKIPHVHLFRKVTKGRRSF